MIDKIAHQHSAIYYIEVFFKDMRMSNVRNEYPRSLHSICCLTDWIYSTMNTERGVKLVTFLALEEDVIQFLAVE